MPKATIRYDNDQNPINGRDISITYVSNDRAFAQEYLNCNAFPNYVYKIVNSCTTRFAIFHNQLKLIYKQLNSDKDQFIKYTNDPRMELKELLMRKTKDRFIAKYDGIEILTYLHNLFNSLKSFLDVYTLLLIRLIGDKQCMSFGKKKIDGEELSGGTFINWLKNSSPESFSKSNELCDYITKMSKEWITEVVAHRDTISHHTDMDDINCLTMKLKKISDVQEEIIDHNNIMDPSMPNGFAILDYCQNIGKRLRDFVKTTILIFDNVDQKLINFKEFNIDEKIWP